MNPEFIIPDWPAPSRVRAAQSTRRGGVSAGVHAAFNLGTRCGDAPAAVAENRRRLRAALRLPAEPAWLHQVHGTTVVQLPAAAGAAEPQADASVAVAPGAVCAVMTADCLPVLFCDEAGTAVAAAHAGWRGLAAGVLEATVAAMPVRAQTLLAWLGPAIGPQAFEVGAEVRAAFVGADAAAAAAFVAGRPAKYYADLYALARQRLQACGVTRIYGGGLCTHSDSARFYSFRRDPRCGRLASLVWLED
jgi:YfiH family protein